MLTIVIDPETLPTAEGANEAVSVAVCDAFNVVGAVIPFVVIPAPTTDIPEICTLPLPPFVSTICFSAALPVATGPKFRLGTFAFSCPVAVEVPVPLRGTLIVGLEPLFVIVKFPVALPAAVGANARDSRADCPGPIVAGVVTPEMVKSLPASVSRDTVTSALPPLLSIRLLVPFDPTATLPKLIAVGFMDNADCALTRGRR